MLQTTGYDREKALAYAHKWALARNSAYADFSSLGGDCTNFISQCLYAGCGVMNYAPETGWYYHSLNERAAAWSGVQYLSKFLTNNRGAGPMAEETGPDDIEPGDIIQLGNSIKGFYHSLIVLEARGLKTPSEIFIATHSYDAYLKKLSAYFYENVRYLHVTGANRHT